MKNNILLACALATALAVGGCATEAGADLALLGRVDTVMRQASPALPVTLQLSASQVRTGEAIAVQVGASQPGYVYLFQIGTDGKTLSMVFPNAMDGANAVAPGNPLTLPRPNWRMSARGPAGVGHLLAIVTEQPVDLMALQAGVSQGRVAVPGRYGAAMATLREVAP